MSFLGLLLSAALCSTLCTGCSSPYLPHNAFRYIPELSYEEKAENETTTRNQGDHKMNEESLSGHRSYFSPDSIRERYAQHISDKPSDTDPLMDIARDTVELMRRDRKSDEEIRAFLADKYHFADATIDTLLGGKQ